MFFKKEGMPQESEIVICTVTKIQNHSVFVSLNDFEGKSAIMHISEVSPGRIRNLNDYVKVGKVIVCKVISINAQKGHIDVSLRRVSESQRREKTELVKQEQKSEKIVEFVAKELGVEVKPFYSKIFKVISKTYDYLNQAFEDVIVGEFDLATLKLDEKSTALLDEIIRQRIKPPIVQIKSKLHIECYESGGVNTIKDLLISFEELDPEKIKILYLGGGSYSVTMTSESYDEIQPYFDTIKKTITEKSNKNLICSLEKI